MEEGIRRAQNGNFAFIGEEASLDLAVARHCNLVRSQEVVSMRGYAIAAKLGKKKICRKAEEIGVIPRHLFSNGTCC